VDRLSRIEKLIEETQKVIKELLESQKDTEQRLKETMKVAKYDKGEVWVGRES